MVINMSEILKKRVKTRFIWFDSEDPDSLMSGQEEEVWEPSVEEAAPEFSGISETSSLPHGQVPSWPEAERSIYKVYEKVAVWLRRPQAKGAQV